MADINYFHGSGAPWPIRISEKLPGQTLPTHSRAMHAFLDGYCEKLWDFIGAQETFDQGEELFSVETAVNTNIINVTNTNTSRAIITVRRAGVISAIELIGEDTLATSDANYVTVTAVNKLGAGTGAIALLAATAPNTTKTTGGAAWTAYVPRALTLSATAANLNVAAGDVIVVTVTTTGTLANVVDGPRVRIRFSSVPTELMPTVVRTAGLAGIVPSGNVANGELAYAITTDSETQHVRLDFGDRLQIPGDKGPIVEARLKIATAAMNTAQNLVFGLASAFNATLDSTTYNAWFKLAATMDIRAEDDDNVTDNDDTDTTLDMVLDTYRTLAVDLSRPGYARYFVDGALMLERVLNLGTNLLQPTLILHKTGTTAVPAPAIEFMRVGWRRF